MTWTHVGSLFRQSQVSEDTWTTPEWQNLVIWQAHERNAKTMHWMNRDGERDSPEPWEAGEVARSQWGVLHFVNCGQAGACSRDVSRGHTSWKFRDDIWGLYILHVTIRVSDTCSLTCYFIEKHIWIMHASEQLFWWVSRVTPHCHISVWLCCPLLMAMGTVTFVE